VLGVRQDQRERTVEHVPDGLPVHARRLHRRMRHPLRPSTSRSAAAAPACSSTP
jgi:hypothetical protein